MDDDEIMQDEDRRAQHRAMLIIESYLRPDDGESVLVTCPERYISTSINAVGVGLRIEGLHEAIKVVH